MESKCKTCGLNQTKFYCKDCLRKHLREFRSSTQLAAGERDTQMAKVKKALSSTQAVRLLRADHASLEASVEEITNEVSKINARIDQAHARAEEIRLRLGARRTKLQAAKAHFASTTSAPNTSLLFASSPQSAHPQSHHLRSLHAQIQSVQSLLIQTSNGLASTRRVLVRSLCEAFDLREATAPVGYVAPSGKDSLPFAAASVIAGAGMAFFGRTAAALAGTDAGSPSGGGGGAKAKKAPPPSKGEWCIAGLVLPVPGDLRRYPTEHITAAVTHTLHFLRLLTFYLGVKLPFEVMWSGIIPGVGTPEIAAGSGSDRGGWAEWTTPYPLYLTESIEPSTSNTTSSISTPKAKAAPSLDSFTTALCMLNYNIAYLSFTQGLEVPLSLTGETLRNCWAICCLPNESFGRSSHATPSLTNILLPPTSSPTFALDFPQVLQAASPRAAQTYARSRRASAGSNSRRSAASGQAFGQGQPEIGDEWDLVGITEVGEEGVG